ncbi:MAG: cytochrome c3 family protein [Desulfobacterales bacterium]|jgi:hypothetical protein
MLKSIMTAIAFFIFLIAGGLAAVAEKTEVTMDAIFVPVGRLALAPPVGVTPKRSAVAFPHSQHFGYTCMTCHHKWDGNSQVQSCTASNCHDQLSLPVKSKKAMDDIPEPIRYYKYAFHQQCIGCHREIRIHNKRLERSGRTIKEPLQWPGPTSCVGCHPRE